MTVSLCAPAAPCSPIEYASIYRLAMPVYTNFGDSFGRSNYMSSYVLSHEADAMVVPWDKMCTHTLVNVLCPSWPPGRPSDT